MKTIIDLGDGIVLIADADDPETKRLASLLSQGIEEARQKEEMPEVLIEGQSEPRIN